MKNQIKNTSIIIWCETNEVEQIKPTKTQTHINVINSITELIHIFNHLLVEQQEEQPEKKTRITTRTTKNTKEKEENKPF